MKVRRASPDDAAATAEVLNAVIAIGGTTAHEVPKSAAEVREHYVDGADVLSSVVAEVAGRIVGWQSVGFWRGEEHIGTFVAPGLQAKGVGVGLFAMTRNLLAEARVTQVFATIRADNVAGLAYYARLGFRDIGDDPDFALQDGRRVGRIHRCLDL